MIKELTVSNFRAFQNLTLSELGQVNVVVGDNAAGKTALLEAVRLGLAGTPQALWQINQYRHPPGLVANTRESFEGLWFSDFHNFDDSSTILAKFSDHQGRSSLLAIYYDQQNAVTSIPEAPSEAPAAPSNIAPLVFDRIDFGGRQSRL